MHKTSEPASPDCLTTTEELRAMPNVDTKHNLLAARLAQVVIDFDEPGISTANERWQICLLDVDPKHGPQAETWCKHVTRVAVHFNRERGTLYQTQEILLASYILAAHYADRYYSERGIDR